jgi:hypothetical protein
MYYLALVILTAAILGAVYLTRHPAFLGKRFGNNPQRLMPWVSLAFFLFCMSLTTAFEGREVTALRVFRIATFQIPGQVEDMLYVYAMCLVLILPWKWVRAFERWLKNMIGKIHRYFFKP